MGKKGRFWGCGSKMIKMFLGFCGKIIKLGFGKWVFCPRLSGSVASEGVVYGWGCDRMTGEGGWRDGCA